MKDHFFKNFKNGVKIDDDTIVRGKGTNLEITFVWDEKWHQLINKKLNLKNYAYTTDGPGKSYKNTVFIGSIEISIFYQIKKEGVMIDMPFYNPKEHEAIVYKNRNLIMELIKLSKEYIKSKHCNRTRFLFNEFSFIYRHLPKYLKAN